MHTAYNDILELTDREPVWWTEDGVPRFCEFHPDDASNIYATEVVLLEIACQECGRRFLAELVFSRSQSVMSGMLDRMALSDRVNYPRMNAGACR